MMAAQVRNRLEEIDRSLIAHFGFFDIEIWENQASVKLVVGNQQVNGGGFCHGGILFALADHALAYAAMSGNRAGVTVSAQIVYHRPARLGDVLTAAAQINPTNGRTASGLVTVVNEAGEMVASLQGVYHYINRPVIDQND